MLDNNGNIPERIPEGIPVQIPGQFSEGILRGFLGGNAKQIYGDILLRIPEEIQFVIWDNNPGEIPGSVGNVWKSLFQNPGMHPEMDLYEVIVEENSESFF